MCVCVRACMHTCICVQGDGDEEVLLIAGVSGLDHEIFVLACKPCNIYSSANTLGYEIHTLYGYNGFAR